MLIGEVAKQTGFSKDTIRWYEKIGLIKLDRKTRTENNYRAYSKEVVERLQLIKQMKNFGFTLKEIKTLLKLDEWNELECTSVSEIMNYKMKVIDQQIDELQQLKSRLLTVQNICSGNCMEAMGAQHEK